MKLHTALFTGAIFAISAMSAFARIGETKQELANRMFAKTQRAYLYNSKEDKLREFLELPYKNKCLLFPDNIEHYFLYKNANSTTSAQGDTIAQHDLYGWEIHIVTHKGKSVMEFYRRHGDPMTVEELEFLMTSVAKKNSDSKWTYAGNVSVIKQWSYENVDGVLKDTSRTGKTLRDILPVSNVRFINIEIPNEVQDDPSFKLSVIGSSLVIKQREAFQKYRSHVDKKAKERSAKTAKNPKTRQAAPQKINAFKGSALRTTTQTVYDAQKKSFSVITYPVFDVDIGNTIPPSFDKSIQMNTFIPIQKDTAFGYTYETADKKIRAFIYKNAVLFIDAEFDKSIRSYMEELFTKQKRIREVQAETSTNAF